ncbi:MAG: hypothetical protein M3552_09920 [Planctomycetota bacterium]|nr:hypothetical protein [Planctomycetaceae bacterium]MDQ3330955.1 hypothetical protein [Planctomycetota bacterium]
MLKETLARLALRASDRDYDPRHAILDLSSELLALRDASATLPPHLHAEFHDPLTDVEQVQPSFPSRCATSPLFDRAGMGQLGRDRAERLVQRLRAIAATIERSERL